MNPRHTPIGALDRNQSSSVRMMTALMLLADVAAELRSAQGQLAQARAAADARATLAGRIRAPQSTERPKPAETRHRGPRPEEGSPGFLDLGF